jgi:dihydrofolate reductase
MATVFAGMAASLDGFIQSASGDLSWLNDAMAPGEDYGFAETEARTGAYVIGANTYREMGGTSGVGAVPTYVVTHDVDLATGRNVRRYAGDLAQLIDTVRSDIDPDKDICVFGGGQLVTQLLELGLIDELAVSVIPVVLGSGVPFFGPMESSTKLELMEYRPFPSGIVILNYRIVRP